jgi:hypothetical protein
VVVKRRIYAKNNTENTPPTENVIIRREGDNDSIKAKISSLL